MVGGFLQHGDEFLYARDDTFVRALGVGGVAELEAGELGRPADRVVPEQRSGFARGVECRFGGPQFAHIGERLSGREQQARPVLVRLIEKAGRSLEHACGCWHVPAVDCPRSRDAEMAGSASAERAGLPVEGSELRPVPERLLEVVPDDLFEFGHPGPGDLEEPVGEGRVHASPRPLKQAVIGGIPDENVAELVAITSKTHIRGPDDALAGQCGQRSRKVGARAARRGVRAQTGTGTTARGGTR